MKKRRNLGYWNNLLLASLISTSLVAGSNPKSSKSDNSPCSEKSKKEEKDRNYIYSSDKTLTTAGDGILLKDYVNHFTLNPSDQIDLDTLLYTKDRQSLSYSVIDSRKGLEKIISYLGPDSCLNGKGIAYKKYLESLLNEFEKNPADSASVERLDQSVKDGCIDSQQDSLYADSWCINEGNYMLIGKSKETPNQKSEGVFMLVDLALAPAVTETTSKNAPIDSSKSTKRTIGQTNTSAEDKKDKSKETYSLRKEGSNKRQSEKREDRQKKGQTRYGQHSNKPKAIRYELGMNYGTNEQINAEAGVGFAIGNSTRVGPYAEFVLSEDERTENETIVTQRERLLVGPGTYKDRKDEITTKEKFHNLYAIGVKLSQKITKGLEGFLAGGLVATKEETDVSGKSTISYERNDMPLGETKIITNTLPRQTSYGVEPIIEAGLEYNVGGPVFIGLSGKYQENNSEVKGGFGFKF